MRPPKTSLNDTYLRALAALKAGDVNAAEVGFRAVLKDLPKSPEALFQLGRVLFQTGRLEEASQHLFKALRVKPHEGAIWQGFLDVTQRWAHPSDARRAKPLLVKAKLPKPFVASGLRILDAAIKSSPQWAEINALMALDQKIEAEDRAIQIASATPTDPKIVLLAVSTLSDRGQTELALDLLDRAQKASPDHPEYREKKAALLQRQGHFSQASRALAELTVDHPTRGFAYLLYSEGTKIAADDPVAARMEQAFQADGLPKKERMFLGFALAKAKEDQVEYSAVMPYLNTANGLARELLPYDIAERTTEVENLKRAFASTDFSAPLADASSDLKPIFVTGLPRSGTTLVEQILSCGAGVTAAGEIGGLLEQTYQVLMRGNGKVRAVHQIPDKELLGIVPGYQSHLEKKGVTAHHLTDKSIQTVLIMGIARLILPNAKFIVVRRDPRDNLLSMYKNMFRGGTHRYTNSLDDLAIYYRTFVDILAFWREKMPGQFYEVWYENLVSNPEVETRKLVDAAGLDWDDAFLSPHKNKREVKTLSVSQVRQPIHAGSRQAWKRYAADLQPLIETLGDLVPNDPA